MRLSGVISFASALLLSAGAHAAETTSDLPTQGFRDEHVEVRKHLEHVREWAGALARQPAAEQRRTAARIHRFFVTEIRPHAEFEEQRLYPLVDRLARATNPAFTASMRHEHRIVGRWIDELGAGLKQPKLDVTAFSRRVDNLLGLLDAHFECEEEVLLPLVDRSMTRAEFEKALGSHQAAKPGQH